MQKYCIARMRDRIVSFLLAENGQAVEIHADSPEEQVSLGDIYIGRVQHVAKNLQAAFVEIAPGQVCFLPLENVRDPICTKKGPSPSLQEGDELVVQVQREAMKSKDAALTANICLTGTYVVLDQGQSGIGVSRSVPEEERTRLRILAEDLLNAQEENDLHNEQAGIILRTNAAQVPEEMIRAEYESLRNTLQRIREKAVYHACYSCLYRSPPQWLKRLLSLHLNELQEIVIEDGFLYSQAKGFLQNAQDTLAGFLRHYEDDLLPMEKLYGLDGKLTRALSKRVWMDSGAYLVIEPTEALTVIDVNSGKSNAGKRKEEAVVQVNLEAARETARQLRLRNLSGIIVVDFINMRFKESRSKVMGELRSCLAKDPVRARTVDMTKLNLVEITRQKVEKPLAEQFK